jgi:magnesium-transporting ATPase (P-type)
MAGRQGQEFPGGSALLAASGAAFTVIALGQAASAFACRSVERPVWTIDLRTNPLLIVAVGVELGLLLVLIYVPPVAHSSGLPPLARPANSGARSAHGKGMHR